MRAFLRPGPVLLALFTVLTGLLYPLAVTGLAQVFFQQQANGSLIQRGDGQPIGSELTLVSGERQDATLLVPATAYADGTQTQGQ